LVKHATFDFTFYWMGEVSGRSGDWRVGEWEWGRVGEWGSWNGAWAIGMGHGQLVILPTD